jgi:hypothetical protein
MVRPLRRRFGRPLARDHWRRQHDRMDPVADHREIVTGLATLEFPWDTLNSLSFALYRTYAVPSIGVLLHDTGEFTERVQKRYDDTGLLLEEILEHGLGSPRGRSAVRRVNQMHGRYDISNDDMRYVLSTFVVVPKRWLDRFGYRSYTDVELRAVVEYYRELGRHMNIRDVPEDYAGFERLLDDYEAAHFAFDPRARRVADSTLDLMTTFPPNNLAPARLMKRFSYALMDEPLLRAFHYPVPGRRERAFFLGLMEVRRRVLRLVPARRTPKWTRDFGYFRSYPGGYRVEDLGTFPAPDAAANG